MLYATANLTTEAALIRAVRQHCAQILVPGAIHEDSIDREQILQALALAAGDLDAADPLVYQHTIPYVAGAAHEIAFLPVGNRVVDVYADELNQDNICDYAWTSAVLATITPPTHIPTPTSLISLIHWPRQTDWIQYNPGPWPGVRLRTTLPLTVSQAETLVLYCPAEDLAEDNIDGGTLDATDTLLVMNQTNAAQNGIYSTAYDEPTDTHILTRIATASLNPANWPYLKRITVAAGTLHAGKTYWLTSLGPVDLLANTPITFAQAMPACNINTSQASDVIIPRAAAYVLRMLAVAEIDKNRAAHLNDFATVILARPLPAPNQALARRIKTATRYANT